MAQEQDALRRALVARELAQRQRLVARAERHGEQELVLPQAARQEVVAVEAAGDATSGGDAHRSSSS